MEGSMTAHATDGLSTPSVHSAGSVTPSPQFVDAPERPLSQSNGDSLEADIADSETGSIVLAVLFPLVPRQRSIATRLSTNSAFKSKNCAVSCGRPPPQQAQTSPDPVQNVFWVGLAIELPAC